MASNPRILFDGECNLCNASLSFVMKHDKKKQFEILPIQKLSEADVPIHTVQAVKQLNTILLIENESVYMYSTAILRVCKHLGGWPKLLYVFIIVPVFIRDAIYRFVARNRYRWFGKSAYCEMHNL